jgi:protein-S-isoprenylcysteine O-methyltransferase Ste14
MAAAASFGPVWSAGKPGRLLGVLALLLLALAAFCGLGGALVLGRNLTPFPKPSSTARLVQHGVYALIRHPLYTAVTCAALGWGVLWASWPAVAAALVLGLYLDTKARHEERALLKEFPEYADYQRRVRRFVPWIY